MAMFFPAGTVEIHRVQHAALLAGVLEAHVAEFDGALEPAELAAAAEILGGLVQHFEHAGAGRESLLQRAERRHQRAHRRGGQQQRGEESPELSHASCRGR